MIPLPNAVLPVDVALKLLAWQAEIDALATYGERVAAAKSLFKSRNTKENATFQAVRLVLEAMCSGARRCCYCEDNAADEVEHVLPKSLFPDKAFVWLNYLYACGSCNGPKNNKYAVVDAAGKVTDIVRTPKAPPVPPPLGLSALIDPRSEDPFDFLELDLLGTFRYSPAKGLGPVERARARWTRDTLDLNRTDLTKARRRDYGSFRARLKEYALEKAAGAPPDALARFRNELMGDMSQPSVFHQMKRQVALIPELGVVFAMVPEALAW